jgi:hypothetical protein
MFWQFALSLALVTASALALASSAEAVIGSGVDAIRRTG